MALVENKMMSEVDNNNSQAIIPQPKSLKDLRPQVYMEMSVDGKKVGRLVFELEGDKLPKTVQNFRCLCTGEVVPKAEETIQHRGRKKTNSFGSETVFYEQELQGVRLNLRGTRFHTVRKGEALVGGDVLRGNGTGGYSIYGPMFKNEERLVKFDKPGTISMVSEGPGLNCSSSIFFIALEADPEAYPTQIAFGHVVEGLEVLEKISQFGGNGGRPLAEIVISDCGQVIQP